MAEPKLEIEKRLDRLELGITTLVQWLVEAQIFIPGTNNVESIEKILYGENMESKSS